MLLAVEGVGDMSTNLEKLVGELRNFQIPGTGSMYYHLLKVLFGFNIHFTTTTMDG